MPLRQTTEHIKFLVDQGGVPKLFDHMHQNVLFDVKHGTSTSGWLRKADFQKKPRNFEHGVRYRACATKTFERSIKTISNLIDTQQAGYYDLGCGKGKTLCMAGLRGDFAHIVGIDYYTPFIEDAQENLDICRLDNVDLHEGDMTEFKDYMETSVVFMYNPAGEVVIDKVRENLEKHCRRAIVIYNKPLHENVFNGWTVLSRTTSPDPDHTTTIFAHGFSEFELFRFRTIQDTQAKKTPVWFKKPSAPIGMKRLLGLI